MITQVLVDKNDPAFKNPSKPIGGFMDEAEAKRRAQRDWAGPWWRMPAAAGAGWSPHPIPKEVVELESIKTLINAGVVVITVGGGGIPVIDKGNGDYMGTAAVIDKDFASSLLARKIKADLFLISTAVEKVAINFGKPDQKWLDKHDPGRSQKIPGGRHPFCQGLHGAQDRRPSSGSWKNGGKQALITNPENIGRALKGETGTWIVP